MNVLVYGATGSQATPVAMQLLNKGHKVFAVSHSAQKGESLKAAGATIVMADLTDAQRLKEINQGMDAVALLIPFFLANPDDSFVYAKNAIDAAKQASVSLIVWNASGFILPHKVGNAAIDARIDIAAYLENSGLPHIIIQPSVYAENLLGPWTTRFVREKNLVAYPTPEQMPVGWIATSDVASLIVCAIEKPELSGHSFRVSGIENLTGTQLAQSFSAALNRQIDYYSIPSAEFGAILDNLFGAGAGTGAAAFYQSIRETKPFPLMHTDMKIVLEKLPVKLMPVEEWVKKHKEAFAPIQ